MDVKVITLAMNYEIAQRGSMIYHQLFGTVVVDIIMIRTGRRKDLMRFGNIVASGHLAPSKGMDLVTVSP